MKWLIATVIALFLFSGLSHYLQRFGLGRLPGDFSIKLRGRQLAIPLGSTLLLSVIGYLISRVL